MDENPYKPAADAASLPMPLRLRRGRSVLIVIATLVGAIFAWDVLTTALIAYRCEQSDLASDS